MAQAPSFIERDQQAIIDEMIADYEQRTGKILYPAQVERLLINAFAYREMLVRERIQYAATQNLVDFANAPVLDYLGALLGVSRLAASKATTVLQFTLVNGHSGVTIPQGTRVGSVDGVIVFETLNDEIVPVGTYVVDLTAQSLTEGASSNGLGIGTITNILDPQAFITAVTNTTVTGGGAEQESDSEFRERIKLAPGSFSTAGPRGAYKYFAKSANPSIIDVAVIGPNDTPATGPGEVEIYPLMIDGSVTPPTVLAEVDAAVNDEKIRPLNDEVTVIAPARTDYTIEVDLTLYTTADPIAVQTTVQDALNAYALQKRQTLGQDIKLSQIISKSIVAGEVYDVGVTQPSADIIISAIEFAYCTGVTVNVIGTNNG